VSFGDDRRVVAGIGAIAVLIVAIAALSIAAEAFSGGKKSEKIWVSRPDGSLQCDPKVEGTANDPLVKAKTELEGSGVRVYGSKKRNDGRMHAAACGIATGNEAALEIEARDLEKARARGFERFAE
jgi:hypothetical protein